ncbi:MAG: single-stranded-DNA-specific exonuclease RecJ [Candidatus Marinimicrobia bacterium]|nr:single-stranded-DNA-specific exonuclease RecJ [Candidatus Neomarinimicrobiota bacterium]
MIQQQWTYKPFDEAMAKTIAEEFNLPPLIAKVMALRGIINREQSRHFFFPDRDKLHSPFLMEDMEKAVLRLHEQIESEGGIVVFGDYDVDGTSGTSLLYLFLKSVGVEVHYYIPDRENEGYGLSKKGIEYAQYIGASLLITCDCAINAFGQINYANELEVDVIITDHHKPDEKLPNAFAILNPNRFDCDYPFKGLCGAGVAFKFALAYCEKYGKDPELVWEHSDLAAIATAADLVPIVDENRIIVQDGIKRISTGAKPGVKALLKTGGLWDKEVTVGRLVFWFSPKINAAGRLGDAGRAVKLLTTKNSIYAMEVAKELERENDRRKEITQHMVEEAIMMVNGTCDLEKDNAIVLAKKGWHHGVVGIVASRIKELYYKPTIIIGIDDNGGRGSCRSIPKFDMVDALAHCKEFLNGFGGHPIAAGLSIDTDKVDNFKQSLLAVANKQIKAEQLQPRLKIDSEMKLTDINGRFLKFLSSLEPYGPGNMRPTFAAKNVKVEGLPRLIGKTYDTLKFMVKHDQSIFEAIGFGMAEHYEKLIRNEPIDIAFAIGENEWNGRKTIQLELKDIKLGGKNA